MNRLRLRYQLLTIALAFIIGSIAIAVIGLIVGPDDVSGFGIYDFTKQEDCLKFFVIFKFLPMECAS